MTFQETMIYLWEIATPTILKATVVTVQLWAITIVLSVPLALPIAFGEISKQAVHTFDPTERGQVLYDALVMFQEICPWYNLCESVSCMGQSPDVGGVESYGRCGYVYQDLYWR